MLLIWFNLKKNPRFITMDRFFVYVIENFVPIFIPLLTAVIVVECVKVAFTSCRGQNSKQETCNGSDDFFKGMWKAMPPTGVSPFNSNRRQNNAFGKQNVAPSVNGNDDDDCDDEVKEKKELTFEERLKELEKKRNSKIIFLCNPKKGGDTLFRNLFPGSDIKTITMADAEEFVTTLRKLPATDYDVDIIVNCRGGSFAATEVIINAIVNHRGTVNVHVVFQASSAATLIALAADNVYVGNSAFFGPVDSQIHGISIPNLAKYIAPDSFWGLGNYIRDYCEKDMQQTNRLIRKIGGGDVQDTEAALVLANGSILHDQPLFYKDMQQFVDFTEGVETEVYDIYEAYMNRDQPSRSGMFGGLI